MVDVNKEIFYEFENKKNNLPIIIFGSGYYCNCFINKYQSYKTIKYIVDNNTLRQGKMINGYVIREVSCIEDEDKSRVLVVIAISAFQNVFEQLLHIGVPKDNIKVYTYSYDSTKKSEGMKLYYPTNAIQEVCITGTVFTLLLYLLYREKEDFRDTYFVFSGRFPEEVFSYFLTQKYMVDTYQNSKRRNVDDKFKDEFQYRMRMETLGEIVHEKKMYVFGHDHVRGVLPLIGPRFTVLEDGSANYYPVVQDVAIYDQEIYRPIGYDRRIKKVVLTGKMKIPKEIVEKVETVSIDNLWHRCSTNKKQKILEIFGLNYEVIDRLINEKRNYMLMTENFSDGVFSDEEKIVRIYADIIKKYDKNRIVIKPHPADAIEYKKYFPDIPVIDKSFPAELLKYVGYKPMVVIAFAIEESSWLYGTFDNCRIDSYENQYPNDLMKLYEF
jgi:hypothetical protein